MEIIVRMLKQNPWNSVNKWPSCYDYIGTYLTRSGAIYTGLSAEDATRLEKEMGYAEGTLSSTSTFWETFAVKIGKSDLILYTNRPEDELKYLFLLKHKNVANGLHNISPRTDYVLINVNSEAEEANKLNKIKREAYRQFDKMSIEEMRKCLRIYGMKSDTMSNELVEAKLSELIENNAARFIEKWVENPNKEVQFLIEEALSKNIIRRNKTQYFYGTDMIGNGLDEVIEYFKDKKNSDIKLSILNDIQGKK